jgi:hypothetical protein
MLPLYGVAPLEQVHRPHLLTRETFNTPTT